MQFRFDEDQQALREAVRRLCVDRFSLEQVAGREGVATDPASWAALADMGVLGVLADPDASGLGPVEAALVFEELGSSLASGPLLWSVLSASFVDGVAPGHVRVCGIQAGEGPAGSAGPVVVEHGRESDVLIVLHPDRIEICPMPQVVERHDVVNAEPLDPLTPAVVLDSVPEGEVVAGRDAAVRLVQLGQVLAAAELVGAAQGALDLAQAYALERHQFDVPIGSFQAIKHLLADMYVRVELARAATCAAAALAVEDPSGELGHASSSAKLLAGEAGIDNGRASVQVLGGMGFTWEMLPHYFLKRSWVLENQFGSASGHGARLAVALGHEVQVAAGLTS
jgi:alkylation response protein AidB-like acyl-CoA dehydrogenase